MMSKSEKKTETETLDSKLGEYFSYVYYMEDDSDIECYLDEDVYSVDGNDGLIYDSDRGSEIANDESNDDDLDCDSDIEYDSDDDKEETGKNMAKTYYSK